MTHRALARALGWIFATLLVVTGLITVASPAQAGSVTHTVFSYGSGGWSLAPWNHPNFEPEVFAADFQPSGWTVEQAPFFNESARCGPLPVRTRDDTGARVHYLQRHFQLPAGAEHLTLSLRVAYSSDIYINGERVRGTLVQRCDNLVTDFGEWDWHPTWQRTGDNVITVRVEGDGIGASFFDAQLTYTDAGSATPTPTPTPTDVPPVFTASPAQVRAIFPGTTRFTIRAVDPDGTKTRIAWSALPKAPVKVKCTRKKSSTAEVSCTAKAVSGVDLTNPITFTATDATGKSARKTVQIQPALYVSMGDSYSAGEGAPPFDTGTDVPGNTCHRSADAWGRILRRDIPVALQAHIACSGAATNNGLRNQQKDRTEQPQLTQLTRLAAAGSPSLVTVSFGGNDVGFADVIKRCYLGGGGVGGGVSPCQKRVAQAVTDTRAALPAALDHAYGDIQRAAPTARIIVVGYPNIMATSKSAGKHCPWMNKVDRQALKGLGTTLDDVIAAEVTQEKQHGRKVKYVSTLGVLNGHELCTKDAYVNAISKSGGENQTSGHPKKKGQELMEKAVAKKIRKLR